MDGKRDKGWLLQFAAFSLIGVLNTAIDLGAFALLTWLSLHYAAAQALAYMAGMANSYLLNTAVTFRAASREPAGRTKAALRRKLRFLIWNGSMLVSSVALMSGAVQLLGSPEWPAKIVVTVLILGLNFYGSKKWVFAPADRLKSAGTGGQA